MSPLQRQSSSDPHSLEIKGLSVLWQKPTPDLIPFPILIMSHSRGKRAVEALHTWAFLCSALSLVPLHLLRQMFPFREPLTVDP